MGKWSHDRIMIGKFLGHGHPVFSDYNGYPNPGVMRIQNVFSMSIIGALGSF